MGGIETGLYCLLISMLWGSTNPLIKKSTKDFVKIENENYILKFIVQLKYLINNWNYILLFLINQGGSVLYFIALQNVDLSLIVPVVNALTFVITGFVGTIIGESTPTLRSSIGVLLILIGIFFCMLDKIFVTTGVK